MQPHDYLPSRVSAFYQRATSRNKSPAEVVDPSSNLTPTYSNLTMKRGLLLVYDGYENAKQSVASNFLLNKSYHSPSTREPLPLAYPFAHLFYRMNFLCRKNPAPAQVEVRSTCTETSRMFRRLEVGPGLDEDFPMIARLPQSGFSYHNAVDLHESWIVTAQFLRL
ncbi:hypothetical protein B0J17DRAFT_724734 [Rhizoctonia solani]|nr:hypothetical protein B0J17DRAFT_724734 [Rhizoctonia solani]